MISPLFAGRFAIREIGQLRYKNRILKHFSFMSGKCWAQVGAREGTKLNKNEVS